MHKRKSPKHVKVLILAIMTTVILAAGGLWAYSNLFNDKNNQTSLPGYESANDLITDVSKLLNSGKNKEAQTLIESQTQYSDDPSVRLAYARSLAGDGNVDKAISLMHELASDNKTLSYIYLQDIAKILENADRDAEALDYYQQAIDAANSIEPVDDNQAFELANIIADCQYYMDNINKASS